ncbi:MAG: OmpA family protein [Ferruginibacter sp.]|nr:OmpA family protein [Ferruginibacter sp.]
MKQKIALLLTMMVFAIGAFAQMSGSSAPEKKQSSFGIHFDAVDFKTPVTFKNSNSPRTLAGIRDLDFGLSLSYWKGLTSKIDWSVKFNALMHDYSLDRNIATNKTEYGVEIEPSINIRPIKDNNLISPFLTAGIGAGYYTGEFGAYVPAGVGIQVNFNSVTYLMLQAQYRFTLTEDKLKDHLFYSLGIVQNFGPEKPMVVPPPPAPVVLDRDGDGIADADDKCPDTPGLAALQGCPDRDGDGIADGDDKCPDVAGIAKYQGCPIPDTDGDGINDEMDKCPTVKGLARYQGCPIPDTDGDGVNDEEDKCPSRPGPASNQGCPEIAKEVIEKINFAAKNVFFATGSYKLLAKSNKSLDEVVRLMKADESLMLDIDGHTDAQGTNESNQVLSDNRAGAVKQYLVDHGIDASRLKSTGYGEEKPVADNKTAAGRAKNRRTEMTVRNY